MRIRRILRYPAEPVNTPFSQTKSGESTSRFGDAPTRNVPHHFDSAGHAVSNGEGQAIDAALAKLSKILKSLDSALPRETEWEAEHRMLIIRSQRIAGEYAAAQGGLDALIDEFQAWYRPRFGSLLQMDRFPQNRIEGVSYYGALKVRGRS